MKKLIILALPAILMTGCYTQFEASNNGEYNSAPSEFYGNAYYNSNEEQKPEKVVEVNNNYYLGNEIEFPRRFYSYYSPSAAFEYYSDNLFEPYAYNNNYYSSCYPNPYWDWPYRWHNPYYWGGFYGVWPYTIWISPYFHHHWHHEHYAHNGVNKPLREINKDREIPRNYPEVRNNPQGGRGGSNVRETVIGNHNNPGRGIFIDRNNGAKKNNGNVNRQQPNQNNGGRSVMQPRNAGSQPSNNGNRSSNSQNSQRSSSEDRKSNSGRNGR